MENYLYDLASAQVELGHEVVVIVHNHRWKTIKSTTQEETINGIKVIRMAALKPVLFTPLLLGLNRRLKALIAKQQPDVLHLHWPNPSLFVLLWNKAAKRLPWVVSWHSDMVTQHSSKLLRLAYLFIKPLEKLWLKQAAGLLVSTQAYADHSEQLKANLNKVKVMPLGINTGEVNSLEIKTSENEWLENHFRIFTLGRLTFYKNHQLLIKAMTSLPDCQLMIGGSGGLEATLATQIAQADLQKQINLLGAISWRQVHQLFATCQVFCLASHDRAESFGVVLLEAMLHNKIILVADTPGSGMHVLAQKYNKGFTFKSGDDADFVRQLTVIKTQYDEISQRPYQFDYDIHTIAPQIIHYYHSIINQQENT